MLRYRSHNIVFFLKLINQTTHTVHYSFSKVSYPKPLDVSMTTNFIGLYNHSKRCHSRETALICVQNGILLATDNRYCAFRALNSFIHISVYYKLYLNLQSYASQLNKPYVVIQSYTLLFTALKSNTLL